MKKIKNYKLFNLKVKLLALLSFTQIEKEPADYENM